MLPLVLLSLARAHVGAPVDAIDIHAVGDSGRLLEASIGLAWSESGDEWHWVCHEAITTADAVVTPHYAVAGRRWLGTVPRLEQARTGSDAVYWTDDGCTWTAATGLSGHEVPEVALNADGTIALAVTADTADSNSIHRSTDGGQTFTPVLTLPNHTFTSVVANPGGLSTAMAGSVDADGMGYLHWSTDDGATWQSHAVIEGEVVAMALHPADASQGYAVIDGTGVETLLRTTDAGESVDVILDPEGFIADVAVGADGAAWVAFGGSAFLHAADGVDFEVATEAPPGLGVQVLSDRVLLATRFELVNSALAEGSRADGFTGVFSFTSFDGPLSCPAGTPGADVCAPLFEVLQTSLGLGGEGDTGSGGEGEGEGGGTGVDTEDPTDSPDSVEADASEDKSTGCGGSAWVVLLPFGLLGGQRRRRDRAAQREGGHR
jgi:hypothetical protein